MKILITGICGFVGSTIATMWRDSFPDDHVFGIDSLSRRGSESNLSRLGQFNIPVQHADIRSLSDCENLPAADVLIDCAANPSVLSGTTLSSTSSRQLVEHNLGGTINLLEYCKRHSATFILISTSRVYSIKDLCALDLRIQNGAFEPCGQPPDGVSTLGITEAFPTSPPISLYGSTKLASEVLALEYARAFDFPCWINRCGLLAGAGQFPLPDQGIISFWINSWIKREPLKYIGFGGSGHQVRDCLHPRDLTPLLKAQSEYRGADRIPVQNVSGGADSAFSLRNLSEWCHSNLGPYSVEGSNTERPYDLPWVVLDSTLARRQWGWEPKMTATEIFTEIAASI